MLEIQAHLPVLVVVVPLIGGVLTSLMGRGALPWAWATLVTGATFALTLRLMATLLASGAPYISYEVGNWPRWWGIEYRVDLLNAFILLVVAGVGFITTIYAKESVADEIPRDRHNLFYTVWVLAICGLLGITVTGDAFNVYVLLEISSLTVYALIAMGKDRNRKALTASLRYLILGSVGASFILLGIGYLMMVTGTLNMEDMREQLLRTPDLDHHRTVLVAFAFLLVGLSLKMALYPLHMWLPKAYTYAPSAVTALLAATATKVAVYMSFRFLFGIFGPEFSFQRLPSHLILLAGACLGVVFSSLSAIRQQSVKRLLAYSSVGQIAYIVAGFSLANESGVAASIIHIFNHAVTKGGMFMAVGAVALRVGGTDLKHMRGLGRRMPLTMAALTVGGLGLVGFPLTAGFISKWYLIKGALDAGMWGLIAIVLLGSILALVYVWKIIEAVYFHEPEDPRARAATEAPIMMLVPMWTLIGLSLYFGVDANFTSDTALRAAKSLLGGAP
jgi:multicomponent Na+:H+ antiporter subunit D